MIWGPFKQRCLDQEKELQKYKERVNELDADFQTSQKSRTQLEAEAAILRGRVRELETAAGSVQPRSPKSSSQNTEKTVSQAAVTKAGGLPAHFGSLSEASLQVIEGIGPKMEELLKENGIGNWSQLAETDQGHLKALLEGADPKFRIIDPGTWPIQAGFAAARSWDELIAYQRSLSQGSEADSGSTKVEKWMIKAGILKKYKQDDLKAIEGIGPKIAALLKDSGIDTWARLASAGVDQIQAILDKAGDRFRLADPMTWPVQAALAAQGEWDELEELQSRLVGGRPADTENE